KYSSNQEYQNQWARENRDKVLASKKKYRDAHKEERAEQQRQRREKLYETNPPKYRRNVPGIGKTPEYKRQRYLKTTYGITLDEYNELFAAQDGCCASCGVHQSELSKPLFVDHDHETGEIRGLLCQHCNTALGYARDDVNILQ